MVLALPACLHATSVDDDRIGNGDLPQSTSALREEIEKISSAVGELDHKIAMEWDRRASLLHRLNDTRKPLPALVNLYKRLERQNKLGKLITLMERSNERLTEKRTEVVSTKKYAEPVEPTQPPQVSEPEQSWKSAEPKLAPRKERPTLKRGKYYLFPFAGVLFPTDTAYKTQPGLGDAELSGNTGYAVGITGGRRFGNLTGGLSLGVNHYKFTSLQIPMPPPLSGHSTAGRGESYLINLSGRLGYTIPLSEDFWLRFGGGLGLGYRAEGGGFYIRSAPFPLKTSKKAAFSYEAFAELGYGLTEHLRAGLGYRYLGAGEHGNFGTYGAHSIEVGLGGDF
jgi:hypothetical protein